VLGASTAAPARRLDQLAKKIATVEIGAGAARDQNLNAVFGGAG
jgi:hypothetical protein